MCEDEKNITEQIKAKREELSSLKNKLVNIQKSDKENYLRNTYLGRCYFHYEKNWKNYLYVNELKDSYTLNCVKIVFIDFEDDNFHSETIESVCDFTCHYATRWDGEATIDECVEITKQEFDTQYSVLLSRINVKML